MRNEFIRTGLLLGEAALDKLKKSRVAVFGAGGVGGYVIEALVRSGIGTIDVIDNDVVDVTNINRQIIATQKTVGMPKVLAVKERVEEINPEAVVNIHQVFYTPETAGLFDFKDFDYVADAIDTVSGKLSIIEQSKQCNTPVISAMGAGNKLEPEKFQVADISKTSVCPLARVIRTELKKRGIKGVKVVFSTEPPVKHVKDISPQIQGKLVGSISFAPAAAGLIMASEIIKDLIKEV